VTPTRDQSTFTMNGHVVTETYKRSGSALSTSTRSYGSPSTPTRGAYGGDSLSPQTISPRPIAKHGEKNWAQGQEYKIKILDMPNTCWTREVHEAMSSYGNVVRIEIQSAGGRDNNAWVVFQYVVFVDRD
jgi:RNA-dependent RNA polymerase